MVDTEPARVAVEHGTDPVRWFAVDGWCAPRASWAVPGPAWVGWEARYDNDLERGKRTTRGLWGWSRHVVYRMNESDTLDLCRRHLGVVGEFDATMHGGGLHVTEPGGVLATHLDYDLHPHLCGKRRALNLVAFCHPEWRPGWGGQLYLADPTGNPVVTIDPLPGRLVGFLTGDLSYHGVAPVTGPAERVSVAVYRLIPAGPHNTRRRALFIPQRGPR